MKKNIKANIANSEHKKANFYIALGLAAVLVFFMASGFASYWNTKILSQNSAQVMHTHEVITSLSDLQSYVKDAETGQRGYVITGDKRYLEPYNNAVLSVGQQMEKVESLIKDNINQQRRILPLKNYVTHKMQELAETVSLRTTDGFEAARDVVLTDRGKTEMDQIREQIATMQGVERELRQQRIAEMDKAYHVAIASGIITGLLGVILSCIVAYLIQRATAVRTKQEWLQNGQVGLSKAMLGNLRVDQLGDNILKFLTEYLGGHAGAFFANDGDEYCRVTTYGVPAQNNVPERFTTGNGLLGQAAKDGEIILLNNVPDGYLTIGSALGQSTPRHLIIMPAATENNVNSVIELGFINPLDDLMVELLEKLSELIAVAIRAAQYRENLQNFLEETQRQSEELQAQGEELRVSNEELEEQGRALRESQTRLEQQQAEMEQTNSQLEEQTQLLEAQKEDLERTRQSVQAKANELEKASQYKSDFLANMSHELRTPLNSSLILAKLLSDNPNGNLTDEQVKFAQTIQSSGNDLLALINDILDLSKIEAGHMEVRPEEITLERLVNDLNRNFEHVAKQKGLDFKVTIASGSPDVIETDRQRLEQILKNLLSNAIKFTEKGNIEVIISPAGNKAISFAVKDSGIGIDDNHQQAIFDAFRQADGTISRKYGGTGLGLSISRELTRLLGGFIQLQSKVGKGSTFIVTIPEVYNPSLVVGQTIILPEYKPEDINIQPKTQEPVKRVKRINDDREHLNSNQRLILVVEDDESFAKILLDMVHELSFQCLIATTAEDALILARQYLPSAVVLDVGLPDNSGLSVLDRLKRDTRTRHIPVHVVSASDHAQTALSLGAVGYMLKPVKREELVETLKKLEVKFSQQMRRVLIVEDDLTQRDSMGKLLSSHNVQTVGVGTAAECLEKLKQDSFDCMVLDLSLPDASGYSLLETLSREDSYSFPPVIVYTGRELSADEEQKLRRYSKSIIIKGAKSPERLLDEVTLFLHQVVSDLPDDQQRMLEKARSRDAVLEGRRILVVEDDVANVYALTSILEPRGAIVQIARNGREAINAMEATNAENGKKIDLVLMDVMMPEVDGLAATREIRKNDKWKKLPIIMLTAKAMRDDQERCLDAGANDYMAKPLDVEKLLSLVRVWMPR